MFDRGGIIPAGDPICFCHGDFVLPRELVDKMKRLMMPNEELRQLILRWRVKVDQKRKEMHARYAITGQRGEGCARLGHEVDAIERCADELDRIIREGD